jgi:hypothetical protein
MHASLFYTLKVATPEPALWPFQGWLFIGQMAYGRLAAPLDAPCHAGLLPFLAFRVRVDERRWETKFVTFKDMQKCIVVISGVWGASRLAFWLFLCSETEGSQSFCNCQVWNQRYFFFLSLFLTEDRQLYSIPVVVFMIMKLKRWSRMKVFLILSSWWLIELNQIFNRSLLKLYI